MKTAGQNAPILIPASALVLALALVCCAASALWAADPARLPDGFRGAPWGARIETLPGMTAVDAEDDVVHYDREGDAKTLGPIAVKLIDYSFYKDRFYHAAILYERGFDVVQETLEEKYGKPDGTRRKTDADGRDYTVTEWLWPGQVYIGHRRFVDEDGGRIFYFYAPLADQAMGRLPASKKAAGGGEYEVKKGETLSLIASRLGVGLEALRAANGNLDPRKLKAGRKLIIPAGKRAEDKRDDDAPGAAESTAVPLADGAAPGDEPAAVMRETAPGATGTADSAGEGRYVVRPGDSPSAIAGRHGLSTAALLRANKGLNPKKLRPGQILIIPEGKTGKDAIADKPQKVSSAAPAVAATGEPTEEATEEPMAPAKEAPSPAREHVIKAGDLIKDLARRYGVSEKDILQANGIKDPKRLQIGQVLKIPPRAAP